MSDLSGVAENAEGYDNKPEKGENVSEQDSVNNAFEKEAVVTASPLPAADVMSDLLEVTKNEELHDTLITKAQSDGVIADVSPKAVEKEVLKKPPQVCPTDVMSDLLEVTKNEELHDTSTLITKAQSVGAIADVSPKAVEKEVLKKPPQVCPTGLTPYETDIQRQIISAFRLCDTKKTGKVPVREVGSIVRSLGMCPTENEVYKLITEVEEEEERPGYIHLTNLLPVLTKAVVENRFQPSTKERLLQAFKTLDHKKKGYLTKDEVTHLFSDYGEPLSYEEFEDFIETSIEEGRTRLHYMKFVEKLVAPKIIPL